LATAREKALMQKKFKTVFFNGINGFNGLRNDPLTPFLLRGSWFCFGCYGCYGFRLWRLYRSKELISRLNYVFLWLMIKAISESKGQE
jgi:hypothetical protein